MDLWIFCAVVIRVKDLGEESNLAFSSLISLDDDGRSESYFTRMHKCNKSIILRENLTLTCIVFHTLIKATLTPRTD